MRTIDGVEALVADIEARAGGRDRLLAGITGSPASGKSTLAEELLARFGDGAVLVPMDGFHLAGERLVALGRRARKGAPDTFDAAGYVVTMRRCRERGPDTVYAPRFVREIEESYGNAIAVEPSARLVLTEGNYLLLEERPWSGLREVLDVVYHLVVDDDVRLDRLVARHRAFGKSPEAAWRWAHGPDERNARMIESCRHRADALVRLPAG